jgi:hypothetical protein
VRGAFDLESWEWTHPFFAGFMWGPPEARQWRYLHDKKHTKQSSRDLMRHGLDMCWKFSEEEGVTEWWAHNGGRFDWLAKLEAAALHLGWGATLTTSGTRVISMKVKPSGEKRCLTFFDSQAVVNMALGDAAGDVRGFALPHRKALTKEDYKEDPRTWSFEKLHTGCRTDCELVLELLDRVETLAQDWGGKLHNTFSQIALSIMKADLAARGLSLYEHEGEGEYGREAQKYCRHAYYGGRNEVFHHSPNYRVNVYDINSSYPKSLTELLPWEMGRWGRVKSPQAAQRILDSPGEIEGVLEAEVDVPDMPIPPLPYRDEDESILFPIGKWRAHFAAVELRYAQTLGVKVRPLGGYGYVPRRYFEPFVARVFESKRAATLQGKVAVATFCKFVANGGYGKFGQRPEVEHIQVCPDEDEAEAILLADFYRVRRGEKSTVGTLGDDSRFLLKKHERWPKHTHFALASYVTAYSRIRLHQVLSAHADTVTYTDTDCAHIHHRKSLPFVGDGLGEWKLEKRNVRSRYWAPKLYLLEGDVVDLKAKGFPLKHRCEPLCETPCPFFEKQDRRVFDRVVASMVVNLKRIAGAKTQLRRGGEFQRVDATRTWKGFSTKRKAFPDGSTVPWTADELREGTHKLQRSPLFRMT